MKPVFADAYYFFALLNAHDDAHEHVTRFSVTLRNPIVTSAWILTEVGDGIAGTPSRSMFKKLLDQLRSDPRITIVEASTKSFEAGAALYDKRLDKCWSLTDCITFEIMREFGIRDALTADKHFEQAGFNPILKFES